MEETRIAWRNLWRNRTRTLITLASIVFCSATLIMADGLSRGMISDLQHNVTQLFSGEAQIHAHDYRRERSIFQTVELADETVRTLETQGIDLVPRLFGFGLVSNGPKSAGGSFWGINPEKESTVFELAQHVDKGQFVDPATPGGVVIGRKLAKILNVTIGDELIVVVEAADGSIGAELYFVHGVLKSVADGVDRTVVLMNESDYRELFSLYGRQFHEFAANTRGEVPLEDISAAIKAVVPDHETKTWKELSPTLAEMTEVANNAIWIILAIFGLAAALGVANTVLMSTYERLWEFGVLKAVGTRPRQIVSGVARETGMLALMGCVLGAIVGIAGSSYLANVGIDITDYSEGLSMEGVAFNPIIRADVDLASALMGVTGLWVLCLIAAFFPAFSAARMDPLDAMRKGDM